MSRPQQPTLEADTATGRPHASAPGPLPEAQRAPSWTLGMSRFAGILMIVLGVFGAVEGLVGLVRNEIYVTTAQYLFVLDLTTWGWVHLLIGIVVAAAGVGILSGQAWGRVVGIAVAAVSALANFLFLPIYPVWSMLIIALDVFVIWALCVVDRDAANS